tara:strand:- start:5920 stop:6375 length:456 start_codon:yes stop_codon:yes gene_type:complete
VFHRFLLCSFVLLSSCTEYFENETETDVGLSYHMQCAGSHTVNFQNENKLCRLLVDQKSNSSCDTDYRKNLYDKYCRAEVFPHKIGEHRWADPKFSYEYKETNKCSTGIHYFYFESPSLMRVSLCEVLQNDSLNNNCSKEKRQSVYKEFCS